MHWSYLGVGLISAATLILQIALTRVFSVAQWYHFAFLSVSVALLGFGASGSILALRSRFTRDGKARDLSVACLCFSVCTLASYLAVNFLPFDSFRIAWQREQLLYLALYYLALVAPFLFGGLAIGIVLQSDRDRIGTAYAVNMVGSALGCLSVIGLLPLLGGSGVVALVAALGAVSALLFLGPKDSRPVGSTVQAKALLAGAVAALVLSMSLLIRPPVWWDVRMSPYKTLSTALRFPDSRVLYRGWNTISRVDVVEGDGIHSAPGLSLAYARALPPQLGLTVDGGNLSPITRQASREDEAFLDYLPAALAYELRPAGRALIIEPGGGLDVLTALHRGASRVTVVEGNPAIADMVRDRYGEYAGHIYQDARVRLIVESGRSFVRRADEEFDVVQLSLTDTYRPITSGAFGLSESYAYTLEAYSGYLDCLGPRGILMVTRWLQDPPSEESRAFALAVEALEWLGVPEPSRCIVAFRSWSTATTICSLTPFTAEELEVLRGFCDRLHFDVVYYPGMRREEANRYNRLAEPTYFDGFSRLLTAGDRELVYREQPFRITPPVDDRPFFYHFFRWSQVPDILKGFGKTWQPFGGSGYLVLIALLVLALVASGSLILLPLALGSRRGVRFRWRYLLYFALLGIGYLWIEIPLMQRFILFLGQPTYAFGIVLFALLLASGIGSAVSDRLNGAATLLALAVIASLYPLLLPELFAHCLGMALLGRITVAVACIVPVGLLMGVPFPKGIAILTSEAPALIPWVWGVNGCFSVISSIVATMLSVSFGFSTVLWLACAAYALSAIVMLFLGRERRRFL